MSERDIDLSDYQKIFHPGTWRSMGACRGKPTKWWFSKDEVEILAATTLCSRVCPVRWRCLAENLDVPNGIFGGFNEVQRKTIRDSYSVVVSPVLLKLLNEEAG